MTIVGGGPVGLILAMLLENSFGSQVAITVYEHRWTGAGGSIEWKDHAQGNVRRHQIVTVQSRHYRSLPSEVQDRLFTDGSYAEVWPLGRDSVEGLPPRNIRISHIEDALLGLAKEKTASVRLRPYAFDPAPSLVEDHVVAICEGAHSRTRDHFVGRFGRADSLVYSLNGRHLEDSALGLRASARLSDAMTVLLTIAQNRFLLNPLHGDAFMNMRLTDLEAEEVGPDGAQPTMSLLRASSLWPRLRDGFTLFGIAPPSVSAVRLFRMSMVQRPRFTAQLFPANPETAGTYGFLLGDAANALHIWPGRGLNSGIASALSLARTLKAAWSGRRFRDADFTRHEAAMSMLQYRHKTRAWNAMVSADGSAGLVAIKDKIAASVGDQAGVGDARQADLATLVDRTDLIRQRLAARMPGIPDREAVRAHLGQLRTETLRTLVASGPWATHTVGGEEIDIDVFERVDQPS